MKVVGLSTVGLLTHRYWYFGRILIGTCRFLPCPVAGGLSKQMSARRKVPSFKPTTVHVATDALVCLATLFPVYQNNYIYNKAYISYKLYFIFITVIHTLKANFLVFHSLKLLTHPLGYLMAILFYFPY